MDHFVIPPDQSGYTFKDGIEVLAAKLDGGASRYRQDIANASKSVAVRWTLTSSDYEYFRDFFTNSTKNGALPFTIDLLIDTLNLEIWKAYFVPGSVRLQSVSGHRLIVVAELEITKVLKSEVTMIIETVHVTTTPTSIYDLLVATGRSDIEFQRAASVKSMSLRILETSTVTVYGSDANSVAPVKFLDPLNAQPYESHLDSSLHETLLSASEAVDIGLVIS